MEETIKLKGCIVVQGATDTHNVKEIKKSFDGYQIIFSTWEDADKSVYTKGDVVLYNKYPKDSGVVNLGLQKESTLAGLKKAKELGWESALKIRSDMWASNGTNLFSIFKEGKLNLLAWVDNVEGGYIIDYLQYAPIEILEELFDVEVNGWFPEHQLTKQFYKCKLDTNVNWILRDLGEYADIHWNHRNGAFNLSKYNTEYIFTTNHPSVWQ